MPSWQNSNRRDRLPPDWPKIRKRVLRRDNNECQWRMPDGSLCGERATDVDHKRHGDDHRDENLQSLCGTHHKHKSGQEGAQALAAKRRKIASRYVRTEPHPGLL